MEAYLKNFFGAVLNPQLIHMDNSKVPQEAQHLTVERLDTQFSPSIYP
mgnify:FL=1